MNGLKTTAFALANGYQIQRPCWLGVGTVFSFPSQGLDTVCFEPVLVSSLFR